MHIFLATGLRKMMIGMGMLSSLSAFAATAPVALSNFNVDIHQTSVSGMSSGGYMAVQFSVAYSSILKGAGIIAGGPYFCAQGDVNTAVTICGCMGSQFFLPCQVAPGATKIDALVTVTDKNAEEGRIDPTANLASQKIWLFSGAKDSVVPQPVMDDLQTYYRHYIDSANIFYKKNIQAEHAMPTDSYGKACAKLAAPYISNCHFDAAGELLKWIYGNNLQPKNSGQLSGAFVEFDQSEFVRDRKPAAYGLADSGFLYVPANCDKNHNQACRLHVVFHGCRQNAGTIQDKYVKNTGYNAWADRNNIIVLYPQTVPTAPANPNACWDWYNYSGNDAHYADRQGFQMAAIKGMINRIAGLSTPPAPFAAACYTATNVEHVLAGRAHDSFFVALANGSNQNMGFDNEFFTTTLKQTGPNFYRIGSCP